MTSHAYEYLAHAYRIRVFAARSRRQRLGLNKPSPGADMEISPPARLLRKDYDARGMWAQARCGSGGAQERPVGRGIRALTVESGAASRAEAVDARPPVPPEGSDAEGGRA